jgi:hypothetical protein
MDVVKKSFEISGDVAQLIDNYVGQHPGMSFTLITNQALNTWLSKHRLHLDLHQMIPRDAMHVKKSANINTTYIDKIEEYKSRCPGLNMTLVLNIALQEWLKNPQFAQPKPYTDSDLDEFLNKNQELMDELAK